MKQKQILSINLPKMTIFFVKNVFVFITMLKFIKKINSMKNNDFNISERKKHTHCIYLERKYMSAFFVIIIKKTVKII